MNGKWYMALIYFVNIWEDAYVLNIVERANALERQVNIYQDYHVKVDYVPDKLYLVCETPEKFRITVNGSEIEQKIEGCFVDYTFKKIEISKHLVLGENVISFDCDFVQSEQFYENRRNAEVFETEKNKLAYDMEIEAVYLTGDFSVRTDGVWSVPEEDEATLRCQRKLALNRPDTDIMQKHSAMRYHGDFVLERPKTEVFVKHIEQQGYPFFCGELILEGELDIHGDHPILCVDWKGINVLKVEINGMEKTMLADNRLSLKEFGVRGKTKVKYTLVNSLRNLLGPLHLEEGEPYSTGPTQFYKELCIWNKHDLPDWNDGYCLAEMSI